MKGDVRDKSRRQRQRFAAEYLKDLDAQAAAIRAGYSPNGAKVTGCRLLKREDVKAMVEKGQEQRLARVGVDADMVVEGLHREATLQGEGSSHSARVSAWGLLGKHAGIFKADNDQRTTPIADAIKEGADAFTSRMVRLATREVPED